MSFFSRKSFASSTPAPARVSARRLAPEGFTLVLSVVSADELRFSASQSTYCKLYVGETPVMHATNSAFSSLLGKKSKGNDPEEDPAATHHSAHTAVTQSGDRSTAAWNETLELPVRDPSTDVLSCRIKNQLPLYCPSIGAAVLPLHQLPVGTAVTKTLPLFKANKTAGALHVQLLLRDNTQPEPIPRQQQQQRRSSQKLLNNQHMRQSEQRDDDHDESSESESESNGDNSEDDESEEDGFSVDYDSAVETHELDDSDDGAACNDDDKEVHFRAQRLPCEIQSQYVHQYDDCQQDSRYGNYQEPQYEHHPQLRDCNHLQFDNQQEEPADDYVLAQQWSPPPHYVQSTQDNEYGHECEENQGYGFTQHGDYNGGGHDWGAYGAHDNGFGKTRHGYERDDGHDGHDDDDGGVYCV
ncbi:hypothetical protein PINS_up010389 [Pythium insidiosum]|nr:hypothetical protein PINS_up010389 [Pythium insidiosum]